MSAVQILKPSLVNLCIPAHTLVVISAFLINLLCSTVGASNHDLEEYAYAVQWRASHIYIFGECFPTSPFL